MRSQACINTSIKAERKSCDRINTPRPGEASKSRSSSSYCSSQSSEHRANSPITTGQRTTKSTAKRATKHAAESTQKTNPSGGYQIVGSHSGTTSIFTATNTSAGVDDVDGGNCILGSPSWPVANASTLAVWYWHGQRDAGDDAAGDFFKLEYSVNDGATWIALASNGDSTSNPTWLNATAAIPAGSDVQLRVQCSDGSAAGDIIECGIDDFSICE